uniref:(-)-kolavenyl diphosphate synthase TPS28, chloroplastic-like n=1 Tax=Erigeron canadensis TaxID=72917 RepID=UPI001CB958C1|nr:(-)-kolavenyl diphosphate synthase TPS28, chloroplastic-like [Erigeron canadensis]
MGLGILKHSDLPLVDEKHALKKSVEYIKSALCLIDDGAITSSAYDTAWVALIEDVDGPSGFPWFPSSLQWIVSHQLQDGSWGEPLVFSAFDRLLNTLACVVALTKWNIRPDMCQKGIKYVHKNLNKLGDEKEEHMTPGFELLFPKLIELAQKLDIKMPKDSPVLKEIYAKRDMKLAKIPKKMFYKIPTILLYSLEGMNDLEWDKLLKLKSENGSFLCSPAATAFAFMQTKDQDCLAYLTNLVAKFNGGVPTFYPTDMYERVWIVDRLQRLGISHYFSSEINNFVDYIHRYWDQQGIGFARNCNLPDIDDTAMAFRVLRTNGYQVSSDVFRHFEKDGQFYCYPGQSAEAVTVMFNLYRAAQVLFLGEKILDNTKKFAHSFLTGKLATSKLFDKWVITKDLLGEVQYALDVPWYASLPRLEARCYLEQYGGEEDVWIAKTLYRLKNVSNNEYLETAKLDYNLCQAVHRLEWNYLQKWFLDLKIEESLNTRALWSYYLAAASIFQTERYNERLAWAKTNVLVDTITSFFSRHQLSNDDIRGFVNELTSTQNQQTNGNKRHVLIDALHETLNQISAEALETHGIDIHPHLQSCWGKWVLSWINGPDVAGVAELIVQTINLSSGRWFPNDSLSHPQYKQISSITNDLCHQLRYKGIRTIGVETKMQELVQLVFHDSSDDLDQDVKQTYLAVAKTFYYMAYFDAETINRHINKVLFEIVV